MKIKLSAQEVNLIANFFQEKTYPLPCAIHDGGLTVDEDLAIDIREWAMNQLVLIGFDEDYNLTTEGNSLESIIDKFYIP